MLRLNRVGRGLKTLPYLASRCGRRSDPFRRGAGEPGSLSRCAPAGAPRKDRDRAGGRVAWVGCEAQPRDSRATRSRRRRFTRELLAVRNELHQAGEGDADRHREARQSGTGDAASRRTARRSRPRHSISRIERAAPVRAPRRRAARDQTGRPVRRGAHARIFHQSSRADDRRNRTVSKDARSGDTPHRRSREAQRVRDRLPQSRVIVGHFASA